MLFYSTRPSRVSSPKGVVQRDVTIAITPSAAHTTITPASPVKIAAIAKSGIESAIEPSTISFWCSRLRRSDCSLSPWRSAIRFSIRSTNASTSAGSMSSPSSVRAEIAACSSSRGTRSSLTAASAEDVARELGDRVHLQLLPGYLVEHLVRGHAHPGLPELSDERAGLPLREPVVAEPLAQMRSELGLERPRAQVAGDVEARVDVREIIRRGRLDLQRVPEDLHVAVRELRRVVGLVELELVQKLRRVAAHHVQELRHALALELVGAREVEAPRQPGRVVGQVLHEHRPALGDGDVAEALLLHQQVGRRVRVVLRVAGLVEQRAPVVGAAHRLDDEDDPPRDLDRRAERPRAFLRALLDVELDVLLRAQVDAHVAERRL